MIIKISRLRPGSKISAKETIIKFYVPFLLTWISDLFTHDGHWFPNLSSLSPYQLTSNFLSTVKLKYSRPCSRLQAVGRIWCRLLSPLRKGKKGMKTLWWLDTEKNYPQKEKASIGQMTPIWSYFEKKIRLKASELNKVCAPPNKNLPWSGIKLEKVEKSTKIGAQHC